MILIIIITSLLLLIGLSANVIIYNKAKKEEAFLKTYFEKYKEFLKEYETDVFNDEIYDWLIKYQHKTQEYLGEFGKTNYKTGNIMFEGYTLITNTVYKFKLDKISPFDKHAIKDTLNSYLGVLEENIKKTKRRTYNPIAWFIYGIKYTLSLPLVFVQTIGLVNQDFTKNIINKTFYNIITGILALLWIFKVIFTFKQQLIDLFSM